MKSKHREVAPQSSLCAGLLDTFAATDITYQTKSVGKPER